MTLNCVNPWYTIYIEYVLYMKLTMIIYSFIGFNTVDTVVYVKFACELVFVDLPVFLYMFMLLPLYMWKLPKKTWFQNTLKIT